MQFIEPRLTAVLSATCGLLLVPFLASGQDHHQRGASTDRQTEDVGVLFRSSCATCHLPPDPDHETDRAWLEQVTDTA